MFDKLKKVFGGGKPAAPKGETIPRDGAKSYVAPAKTPAKGPAPSDGAAVAAATDPADKSAAAAPAEAKVRDVADSPLRAPIVDALKKVYDPEIPVDIWELGLIYAVRIGAEGEVEVDMTLTSPNCPSAEELPGDAEKRVRGVEGVKDVKVDIVWDPPWDKDKMSEVAKLELGMD